MPPQESLFAVPGMMDLDPIVVRSTRYHGELEGYEWVALPNCWVSVDDEYPGAFTRNCADWWADPSNIERIGVGDTPNEAMLDLIEKRMEGIYTDPDEELESDDPDIFAEAIDALATELDDARRDAYTLITAQLISDNDGNNEFYEKIYQKICKERHVAGSYQPLVATLAAISTRLARDLADATLVEPLDLISQRSMPQER